MQPVVSRPAAKLAECVELGMRRLDVIGFAERLERDLPVALEYDPLAPARAHVLELERIEHVRNRPEIVAQGGAAGIEVDPDPASPIIDGDLAKTGPLRGQRPLPVVLVVDEGALAFPVVGPAVEAADEIGLAA